MIDFDIEQARHHRGPTFAMDERRALGEAVLALGVSVAAFDRIVDPATMVGHPRRDLGLDNRPAR